MSTPSALDVVNQFTQLAASTEDLSEIEVFVSPDVDWYMVGDRKVVPWAGKWEGKKGVSQFYTVLREKTSNEHFNVRDVLTQKDRVVIIGDLATRVKETGKLIECEFVFDFEVKNGLITRFRPFEDSHAIAIACSVDD